MYIPLGVNQFELPKVLIAEIGIGIMSAVWIIKSKHFEVKQLFSKSFLPLLGLLLLSIADLIFLSDENSFLGNEYRLQGILLFWMLCLFSFLSSKTIFPKFSKGIYCGFSFALFLSSFLFGTTSDGRAFGTLGEPNALAAIAVFFFPFGFLTPQKRYNMLFSSFIGFITLGTILLSGSRSGLLAFSIEVTFMILVWKKMNLKLATFFCILMLGFGMIIVSFDKTPFENRFVIWKTAFQTGLRYPITGIGMGNIELGMKSMNLFTNNRMQGYRVDSSHNLFLDWFIQGGIVGFSLFVLLIFQTFRRLIKEKERKELAIFLGIITCLSFNPGTISVFLVLWWLIGKSFSEEKKSTF